METAEKLKNLETPRKRQAAQALLNLYEELGNLQSSAQYVETEISLIINFHKKGEYNAHSIENYVECVNDANNITIQILKNIFLSFSPTTWPDLRGSHKHDILEFLRIVQPDLASQVSKLLGLKLENLSMLTATFDLLYKEQRDKNLRTIKYISRVNPSKLSHASDFFLAGMSIVQSPKSKIKVNFSRTPLDTLVQEKVIKINVLEASSIDSLLDFNERINKTIKEIAQCREKIRNFIVRNFQIEDIF